MTSTSDDLQVAGPERQRRIRRTLWWLVALALGFYVGFIALSISHGRG